MRTLASAAALLAKCRSLDDLVALARIAGFADTALPLDPSALRSLGVDELIAEARVIEGTGTLRALLARSRAAQPLRSTIAEISTRLSSKTPQLLWLTFVLDRDSGELAIATWSTELSRPRSAMLLVEQDHIAPSDAETLCALESADGELDLVVHMRWLELLGREALTRRFYRALEQVVRSLADSVNGTLPFEHRHEISLLYVSRLLFISFLETKGWMNGDRGFLVRWFAETTGTRRGFHQGTLLPLFFGTLNTPVRARATAARRFGRVPFLNGGLFARTSLEGRHRTLRFPDEALSLVFDTLLGRYRFTAREATDRWSEASIDPEMLGKAFESLMASRERRASGAFYTPHQLVEAVTNAALERALAAPPVTPEAAHAMLGGGEPQPELGQLVRQRLAELRVLDPACGSGAFLVHALDALATVLVRCGDARRPVEIRREILTRAIFGVDINPTAVWLCQLRLWLAVVTESEESDPFAIAPLPNLDRHVRVGDALAGDDFHVIASAGGARIAALRERYARACGARKRTLERELERRERRMAIAQLDARIESAVARRRDLVLSARQRDLFGERRYPPREVREALARARREVTSLRTARDRLRSGAALPFSFSTHFPDIGARNGFDVVVGNPPWVRLHRIPPTARATYRQRFESFRCASWARGALVSHAGAGFTGQVDLAALFTERSLRLLRPGGVVSLLLPIKLWRSIAGGGVRQLLRREGELLQLEDWSESRSAFDAAVYPSLLLVRRAIVGARLTCLAAAVHHRSGALCWQMAPERLGLDTDPASPWLLLPPEVRAAFDRVTNAGVPLAEGSLGRPTLGVKCGFNDAFIVTAEGGDDALSRVRASGRVGVIERTMLRPLLRGETIGEPTRESIIWTHAADGTPLATLPPHAGRWLAVHRARLAARSDARQAHRWWSLFRVTGASARLPRVAWADVARSPRAIVLPAGDPTVALNSCYVLPCASREDADAFAALLSSPLVAAWLNALAEPARGGYRRYLAWTIALLPLPADWPRARTLLLAKDAKGSDALTAVLRAYRLRYSDVAPLLTWNAR